MKKVLLIIMMIGLIVNVGCSKSSKNEKEKKEENNIIDIKGDDITNDKVIDGVRIKNVSLVIRNDKTEYRATIENTVTTVKKISHIKVSFLDEMGSVLKSINFYNFNNLRKGETQDLPTTTLDIDLSLIKKIEYIIEE